MSIAASADGTTFTLLMGATVIGTFSASGITAGTLLATAAEAQSYSNNTKLLSPALLSAAFQGGNQTLSTSGYQKLPGGLIIQWGTYLAGATSVSFPITFPNLCMWTSANGISTTVVSIVLTRSATGFTINSNTPAGVFAAIGY